MKKIFSLYGICCLFLLALTACDSSGNNTDNDYNPPSALEDLDREGFLVVSALGHSVTLGTSNDVASVKERPSMKVNFTYDFSIGRHEVTCSEFRSLMPGVDVSDLCEKDLTPVAGITYYDAILYANERSKSEKYDTAYVYSSATFNSEGNCVGMDGFSYRPEVSAYRLPTEAEWMLVAAKDWNPDEGWNAKNSDYRTHEVCSRNVGESGVCDMEGNVKEWVNDWLGLFRDTTLTNYVGAPDGGNLGERILKGGSYRNDPESVSLHGRGDVYTVTSATRADYVGFRLAFGNIPDATWMSSNGTASASRVVTLASSADVKSLTGTFRTRLAFRNDVSGNLVYVDYFSGSLSAVEILDTIDAYHPEISPDGQRVAFCTGLEGVSGKSTLYVRDLNSNGSNLVKLDVESAAIPRWRVLENGDTAIVYVTDAGNNKDEAEFARTSTWQVTFSNGKFGKPQKLFDGNYHGGVQDDFAVSGARLLRARVGDKEETWYNEEQACNASLTRDDSKRTLFLDFGGKTGKKFAGEDYGTHKMLLVADSAGRLLQAIPSPAGYSFDHSEWAVGDTSKTAAGEGLAVVTLSDANGSHKKVALLNTADSTLLELAEGDELWHPCLWVRPNANPDQEALLDSDSAGV